MVIVAAVDRTERANDITAEAEVVARKFGEPVHVVHVLTSSAFVNLGRTKAERGDTVDMDEIRATASDIAADAAASLDVPSEAVGLVGEPAAKVVQYATEHDARYIVVGGRKRSPTGKAIFGSVSQSILLNAKTPVIWAVPRTED